MSKVFIEETTLSAIGDAIREKTGSSDLINPLDMPSVISSITTGGGEVEIPVFTGDCSDRFANDGWTWFINEYGNKITTKDITHANSMFVGCETLTNIPFEINMKADISTSQMADYMFDNCYNLTEIPKINSWQPGNLRNTFSRCYNIRYFPEDMENWIDWKHIDKSNHSSYSYATYQVISHCRSLRKAPMFIFEHSNTGNSGAYGTYAYNFQGCYCLDEIKDIPISEKHMTTTKTGNLFLNTFDDCARAKDITFKLYDGVPRPVMWKSQVIDLTGWIGWIDQTSTAALSMDKYLGYDTVGAMRIKDDATYQALKENPDCYAGKIEYSRYNHDSAVATINSLPDTSAYLATAGGTNTIKFKGKSGSLTDAGAINTLTEEEIAVATAKGWTVSLT